MSMPDPLSTPAVLNPNVLSTADLARVISLAETWEGLIALALDGVDSPRSKRNYRGALTDFLTWWDAQGRPTLSKAVVQQYKTTLLDQGLAPSTINLKLSAIRKLISEAADNGLMDPVLAQGIKAVKGVPRAGVRLGNWLSLEQARRLVNTPDPSTRRGLRDRAILCVLVLAGLRREECAALTVEHLQQREGRWVITDLVGKRGRVRSVPVRPAVKGALDAWLQAAGITSGALWRAFRKGDHLDEKSQGLSSQALWGVVSDYAGQLGLENIAPHDLRRTYAKLAHQGGAALEQISLNLGHESIRTTELYLGVDLDLQHAPSDCIDISLERNP
jgi:site-specific recombinase XerD